MSTKQPAPDAQAPQQPGRYWRLRTPPRPIVYSAAVALGASGGILMRLANGMSAIEDITAITTALGAPAIVGGLSAWLMPDPRVRQALPLAVAGSAAFSFTLGFTHIDVVTLVLGSMPSVAIVLAITQMALAAGIAALAATAVCVVHSMRGRHR